MTLAIKHSLSNSGYFLRYYWKRIVIALALVSILFGGMAFAAIDYNSEVENASGMLKLAYDWVDEIVSPKVLTEVTKLLNVGYNGSEVVIGPYTSSGAGAIFDAIFKVSCVIAVMVLAISFLTDLAMTRQDNLTEENLIRKLFMFVVGYLLIINAMKICFALADTGTWVTEKVVSKISTDGGALSDANFEIKKNMWIESHTLEIAQDSGVNIHLWDRIGYLFTDNAAKVGFILQLMFPYLAVQLAWVIASVVCFSRAIELYIMSAFSPLAFMDSNTIDGNFTQSAAWRFLKNILAIAIQGAIIAATVAIASSLIGAVVGSSSSSMGEFVEQSLQILMVIFAEVSLVMRSQGIAKSVLSVG